MSKMYLKTLALTLSTVVGFGVMTANAQHLTHGIYTDDKLYTFDDEVFLHDLSNVRTENLATGQVINDSIAEIIPMLNHNYLTGDLTIAGRNYYFYEPRQGSVNSQETYPMRFNIQPVDSNIILGTNYTINNLAFGDVIQLLDMQRFNITANGGIGGFIIAPVERDNGKLVPREDIKLYPGTGPYAPSNGQLVPHSSLNDVYYYVADPGFNGVDTILMFSENREGKMGYQFYNVYVSNN